MKVEGRVSDVGDGAGGAIVQDMLDFEFWGLDGVGWMDGWMNGRFDVSARCYYCGDELDGSVVERCWYSVR